MALIHRLVREYPDGWALSTSAAALRQVLVLCPARARVAVWHVPNAEPPRGGGRIHLAWEPVIYCGGRAEGERVYNVLRHHHLGGWFGNTITGQKPAAFSSWVFRLLGAGPGDTLDDLFAGSGAVAQAWREHERQASFEQLAI